MVNINELIKGGKLDTEIAVVIASRECKGIERARSAGVEVHLVAYKDFGRERVGEYSAQIAEHLDAAGVDLIVQAGFLSLWQIPPQYEGKVMNIHPALLPSFGGDGMYGHHVHEAVLAAGCKVSGCTVHFVTNEYDAGPIILQRAVEVYEGDTPDELAGRVFAQECVAYPDAIQLFAKGQLQIDGRVVRIKKEAD